MKPGETVVDATAGNGHDTIFLSRLVGPSGRVIAFDIDPQARIETEARHRANDLPLPAFHQISHAEMERYRPTGHRRGDVQPRLSARRRPQSDDRTGFNRRRPRGCVPASSPRRDRHRHGIRRAQRRAGPKPMRYGHFAIPCRTDEFTVTIASDQNPSEARGYMPSRNERRPRHDRSRSTRPISALQRRRIRSRRHCPPFGNARSDGRLSPQRRRRRLVGPAARRCSSNTSNGTAIRDRVSRS